MERLTKRSNKTVHDNGVCCTHFNGFECSERMGECADNCPWEEAVWSKLADYEDKQEQGLLISLPCKLWTTVYEATVKCKLNGSCAVCHKEGCWKCKYAEKYVAPCVFNFGKLGDFGKTVFLTRSEAESALAKMNKED